MQPRKHSCNLLISVSPALPYLVIDITQVIAIADPHSHFVRGPGGHTDEPSEFRTRIGLLAKPFGKIGADRLGRAANLIAQRPLFDDRKVETYLMDLQREPVRPLEYLKVFKP